MKPVISNEHSAWIELIPNDGRSKATITFDGTSIVIDRPLVDSSVDAVTPVARTTSPIIAANSVTENVDALDAAIGADHTPLTRTVGLTAVANTVNANIDALDTAIGTDAQISAVSRTTGPVSTAQSVNQNIDDLDAAIGADHTPVTRTVGLTAVANTVNANIDALDTVIGFDAQLAGSPKNISSASTIYQNLDALDTYKSVQTVKKTIGGVGVANCDFNFATAEDQAEQVIDLGAIVPARARVIDVYLITDDVFTGATTLVAEVGNSSSGAQFIASATIYADDAVLAQAVGGAFTVAPAVAASNVFVSATPGANWSAVTAGKVSVYVTFINVANI